nr:MAG TPA: hypothetical protein [Caudoviricetes sp.]
MKIYLNHFIREMVTFIIIFRTVLVLLANANLKLII